MTEETVSATTTISASAETVFAVLADPSRHAAIDGTGRVRDSLDSERLTGSGQVFRIGMYHENHPDGSYEMANQVLAFEPPRVISWQPGYVSPATGKLEFGGWVWRYDLTQLGPEETAVTLSYDWSAVGRLPASASSSRRSLRTISTTRSATWPRSSRANDVAAGSRWAARRSPRPTAGARRSRQAGLQPPWERLAGPRHDRALPQSRPRSP